jgi:CDP-glucose 4,6-dehydratase
MGARVTGIALPPDTRPNLFELTKSDAGIATSATVDIRDPAALAKVVRAAEPEVVFHLAAQPLVRRSYAQPLQTFATNVMGTAHLLESLRGVTSIRVAVMVTTDKVYANREWLWPYREEDALGGCDPYSASKAAAEMVIASYRQSFLSGQGLRIASARAGNVIGGGDWSEDRLLPDAVRAWQNGRALEVRHPASVRPWQHVLEPLSAYLLLAQALWFETAPEGAYNVGPLGHDAVPVRKLIELAQRAWGGDSSVVWDESPTGPHEAGLLSLEISKARHTLGYQPRWGLETSVQRTMDWYRDLVAGQDARALCSRDIDAFEGAV